jgi:hypothetical protein
MDSSPWFCRPLRQDSIRIDMLISRQSQHERIGSDTKSDTESDIELFLFKSSEELPDETDLHLGIFNFWTQN